MFRQPSVVPFVFVCAWFASGCGSTAPCAEAPSASAPPDPTTAAVPAGNNGSPSSPGTVGSAPAAPSSATPATTTSADAHPEHEAPSEAGNFDAEQAGFAARAIGPATGGPRGTRPCAFHESVDTYQRTCVVKVNPDGSVLVTAKGTRLNSSAGFEFTMHGGENHQWFAKGTLNAFAQCEGPFAAPVSNVVDNGVNTYELRFKRHCKIVIR